MLDLICIGLVLLFFALSAWLVRGCEALEKEEDWHERVCLRRCRRRAPPRLPHLRAPEAAEVL